MKKAIVGYAAILIGLFVILSLSDLKGEYAIEQKLWHIHRQFIEIEKDPDFVPDQAFDDLVKRYQQIIHQHPDSQLIPRVYFIIGRVYLLKKEYDTAREKFQQIVEIYPDNKEIGAEALMNIGKTYEAQGNWTQANNVYQNIIKDYPLTGVGLGIPLYIAHYHRSKNDFKNTLEAYDSAIQYYKQVAAENADSKVEFEAISYLADCYLEQKRWTEAIHTLGDALRKFSASNYLSAEKADKMIKTINIVSAYQMKDYSVAIKLYEGIIEKKPENPLNDYLQKMIDAFHKLEEKGVKVFQEQ